MKILHYIGILKLFYSPIIGLYRFLRNILTLSYLSAIVDNKPEMKLLNRLVVEMKKVQECVIARKQRSQ